MQFQGADDLDWPRYSPRGGAPDRLADGFFERLIRDDPRGDLAALARFRLADCELRRAMYPSMSFLGRSSNRDLGPALARLRDVGAAEGTTAWAWTMARLATIHAVQGDHAAAIEQAKQLAERMPNGPERSIALATLGRSQEEHGQSAEAARTYQALLSMPDLCWPSGRGESWAPYDPNFAYGGVTSRDLALHGQDRLAKP